MRSLVPPPASKFQISLPTSIAPTYNNMVPTDWPALIPVLTTRMLGEVAPIAQALPDDRIALQWDVCKKSSPGSAITSRGRSISARRRLPS